MEESWVYHLRGKGLEIVLSAQMTLCLLSPYITSMLISLYCLYAASTSILVGSCSVWGDVDAKMGGR